MIATISRLFVFCAVVLLCVGLCAAGPRVANGATTLSVSIDFAGGSGEVVEIDQEARLIRLVPTPHKDRGWQCWWCVRVDGVTPGETITLDVGNAPWATPDRASFSADGRRWVHTSPGTRNGKRIAYRQEIATDSVFFAWGRRSRLPMRSNCANGRRRNTRTRQLSRFAVRAGIGRYPLCESGRRRGVSRIATVFGSRRDSTRGRRGRVGFAVAGGSA